MYDDSPELQDPQCSLAAVGLVNCLLMRCDSRVYIFRSGCALRGVKKKKPATHRQYDGILCIMFGPLTSRELNRCNKYWKQRAKQARLHNSLPWSLVMLLIGSQTQCLLCIRLVNNTCSSDTDCPLMFAAIGKYACIILPF